MAGARGGRSPKNVASDVSRRAEVAADCLPNQTGVFYFESSAAPPMSAAPFSHYCERLPVARRQRASLIFFLIFFFLGVI